MVAVSVSKPKTIEIVIYKDATGAVTEYDRDDNGVETYIGRTFLDASQVTHLVQALDEVGAITRPHEWFPDEVPV